MVRVYEVYSSDGEMSQQHLLCLLAEAVAVPWYLRHVFL